MRSITNVVLSFFELLEAEGRSFRKAAVATAENIAVVFFALGMVFAGVAVAMFSFYLWLSGHIGRVGGSAVVAVILLALGGSLFVMAHSKASKGQSVFERGENEEAPAPEGEYGDEG